MTQQLDMLTQPMRPLSRAGKSVAKSFASVELLAAKADPITSHKAAERMVDSGALGKQMQTVLNAVRRWPGSTSAELAEKIAAGIDGDKWRFRAARRLPDLAKLGRVEQRSRRVCFVTGAECVTWWIIP